MKYEKAVLLQFKKQPIVVFIEIEISWLTLKESSENGSFAIRVCISWPVSSENPLKNWVFLKATLSNYNISSDFFPNRLSWVCIFTAAKNLKISNK